MNLYSLLLWIKIDISCCSTDWNCKCYVQATGGEGGELDVQSLHSLSRWGKVLAIKITMPLQLRDYKKLQRGHEWDLETLSPFPGQSWPQSCRAVRGPNANQRGLSTALSLSLSEDSSLRMWCVISTSQGLVMVARHRNSRGFTDPLRPCGPSMHPPQGPDVRLQKNCSPASRAVIGPLT